MSIGPFEAPTPTLLLRISCGFAMIMMWGSSSGLYPIAIREPGLVFDNRKKPAYIGLDSRRRAEFLGLPLGCLLDRIRWCKTGRRFP